MKLNYDRRSKDPTYFIQYGFRNGKKVSTRNVKRIGRHSELLAITDDPLAYAKEQVRIFNEEYRAGKVEISLKVDFTDKLPYADNTASRSGLLNVGYLVLQRIYHDLEIRAFIESIQKETRVTFDCNDVNRFLTFARILDPKSKLGTWDDLHGYFEQPQFGYQHILRFMDVIAPRFDEYIAHLYEKSCRVVRRDQSVFYFDCSNFYFETEEADEEYVDGVTGEVLTGLRQYGFSKQHQPSPLVGMGLFMDADGIPISMCIRPGNENEQLCAVPLEKKLLKLTAGKPFIYCADAGLGSYNIRKFNEMGGRSFIVTQSVKKLSKVLKEAVFNDYDYRRLSDGTAVSIAELKGFDCHDPEKLALYNDTAYKTVDARIALDTGILEERHLKDGRTKMVKSRAPLKQRVIITFSRKMMEYQRHVRDGQVARAEKLLNSGTVGEVKKGNHDVRRFVKRTSKGKDGDDAIDHYTLDTDKIADEARYDGYYAIATNLEDDVRTILKVNAGRYQIEECFRIMKTNFGARPAYHHKPERITAHFLICYTALLIYRLLEKQLDERGEHFTINEVITTLRNMQVLNIDDQCYRAAYSSSRVCTALNELYSLDLDRKYYQPKELNKKVKKIL